MPTTSNGQNALFCAADGYYSMQMAVMLNTCCKNYSGDTPLPIFIVDGGLTDDQRTKVEASVDRSKFHIHWQTSEAFQTDQFFFSNHITVATYFRLLLPDVIPDTVRRVVYLDVDTAVMADVSELFEIELGENVVLARRQFAPESWEFSDRNHYFNAGVMVIDADQWRELDVSGKSLDFARKQGKHNTEWDQGALNVTLEGRWGELAGEWNAEPDQSLDIALLKNRSVGTRIIHYLGVAKPWYTDYPFKHLQTHYFSLIDETAWKGWRPKNGAEAFLRTISNLKTVNALLRMSSRMRAKIGLNYSSLFKYFRGH